MNPLWGPLRGGMRGDGDKKNNCQKYTRGKIQMIQKAHEHPL